MLRECSESPLGTCLLAELSRFVEILDLYRPIADFPIEQLFKFSKREVGTPNSIIQQAARGEQGAAAAREPQTAVPTAYTKGHHRLTVQNPQTSPLKIEEDRLSRGRGSVEHGSSSLQV